MSGHKYHFDVAMSCSGCSSAVDRVLKRLDGVQSIDISLEKQSVDVTTGDSLDYDTVHNTIAKTGKKVNAGTVCLLVDGLQVLGEDQVEVVDDIGKLTRYQFRDIRRRQDHITYPAVDQLNCTGDELFELVEISRFQRSTVELIEPLIKSLIDGNIIGLVGQLELDKYSYQLVGLLMLQLPEQFIGVFVQMFTHNVLVEIIPISSVDSIWKSLIISSRESGKVDILAAVSLVGSGECIVGVADASMPVLESATCEICATSATSATFPSSSSHSFQSSSQPSSSSAGRS